MNAEELFKQPQVVSANAIIVSMKTVRKCFVLTRSACRWSDYYTVL